MVKAAVATLHTLLRDLVDFVPPGTAVFIATGFIADGAFIGAFRQELIGTLLMVGLTFSAGKWIGSENLRVAWISHFLGVLSADYFGGGPQVNPAMSLSMFSLGKVSYTEMYVRIAGQMLGGLVAFPVFHALSNYFGWDPFGGPEFTMGNDKNATAEAFLSEFCATFILCFLIYAMNFEINFGKHHYLIKQSITALGIRALIEIFPTAGPAMNPMLATAWAVFGVGTTFEYPTEVEHYFVYWIAPCSAAVLASLCYVVYAGGTFFGRTLPIGPLKPHRAKPKGRKTD